jgi:hypothetical protein
MKLNWRLKISKCVVVISKKNKAYHYYREVKNITKRGLYLVEMFDEAVEDGLKINTRWTAIDNGKDLEDFDEIYWAIERLKVEKLRTKKINNILYGN